MLNLSESEIMKEWGEDNKIPLASICVRTYNLEKYIEECLESLLAQVTDFRFEILIDDDCSTDNTAAIVNAYAKQYPSIVFPNIRDINVGKEINFAENLQRARGKYIAICDGDDFWTDTKKLQLQVKFLENDDEGKYVVTYCKVLPLHENENFIGGISCPKQDCSAEALQKHSAGIVPSSCCFRNLEEIKNYPKEYLFDSIIDDHLLWSILGNYGGGKLITEIAPIMYRQHNAGAFAGKKVAMRNLVNLETDFMLYKYYKKRNNMHLAHYFLQQVVTYFIKINGSAIYSKLYALYLQKTLVGRTKNMLRHILAIFYPEKFPCIKNSFTTH